jgi:hypothetical protein
MFGVIDRLLLRPPAEVSDPARVFEVHGSPRDQLSFPAFVDFRDQLATAGTFAVQTMPRAIPIGRGDDARMADAVLTSRCRRSGSCSRGMSWSSDHGDSAPRCSACSGCWRCS